MEIGKRSLDWRSRPWPSAAAEETAAPGKSGVQVVDQFTTVEADYDFVNVIGWEENAGRSNKIINDEDFVLEGSEFSNIEESIILPSAGSNNNRHWPNNVILRQTLH